MVSDSESETGRASSGIQGEGLHASVPPTRIRALGIAIALLAVLLRALPGPRTIDDAYITFQYARNLASGQGLVFNPDQAVLGTTSPLYALILSIPAWIYGPEILPLAAMLFNAALDGLTALLLLGIGRKLLGAWIYGVALAIIHAVATESILFSAGGMETSLFLFLLWSTVWLMSEGMPTRPGVTAGLACLTRPEGVLLVAWLAGYLLVSHWKPSSGRADRVTGFGRFAVTAALVCLPWLVFAWLYYGSPFPHSIRAKQVAYETMRSLRPEQAWLGILRFLGSGVWGETLVRAVPVSVGPIPAWAALTVILACIGGTQRRGPLLPLAGFLASSLLLLGWGNPLLFGWYFVPLLSVLHLLALAGGLRLISRFRTRLRGLERIGPIAFVAILTAAQLDRSLYLAAGIPSQVKVYWEGTVREDAYREIAEWLKGRLRPGDRVMAVEVGTLAFYTEARILDAVGLVSPEMVPLNPPPPTELVGSHAISLRMVQSMRPEWIVGLDVFLLGGLLNSEEFHARYEEVHQVPCEVWGSRYVRVFRARAGSPTTRLRGIKAARGGPKNALADYGPSAAAAMASSSVNRPR